MVVSAVKSAHSSSNQKTQQCVQDLAHTAAAGKVTAAIHCGGSLIRSMIEDVQGRERLHCTALSELCMQLCQVMGPMVVSAVN
jgi:hypothetical protein